MLSVGPVVARDDAAAQALIHVLAVRAEAPVRLGPAAGPAAPSPDPVLASQGQQLTGQLDQACAHVMQALG